mmetsp:Transcript_9863/g.17805  ORF Transcript_9863/g.17805 Transcript_9863/m.17805 type:complete len:85 (-) Transcript_9863:42-296(-)
MSRVDAGGILNNDGGIDVVGGDEIEGVLEGFDDSVGEAVGLINTCKNKLYVGMVEGLDDGSIDIGAVRFANVIFVDVSSLYVLL